MAMCERKIREKCKNQIALSESYKNDINSNVFFLTEDSLSSDGLIISSGTGFINGLLGLKIPSKDKEEKYRIVLIFWNIFSIFK